MEHGWDYPRPRAVDPIARLTNALQEMAGELASARRESRERERQLRLLRGSRDALRAELTESRTRLADTAYAERRRLERDLHDGIQQDLIVIRVRLENAVEALKADPAHAEQMLITLGAQLDDALGTLRSLARGIYPAVLQGRGVAEALRSAARRLPVPISVIDRNAGRWPERVEIAIYFCCLEAFQNVTKHAGAGVRSSLRLWQEQDSVHFHVQDNGRGFELMDTASGSGLANMRDRIAAVGGTLAITSRPGQGTTVRGRVPIAPKAPAAEQDAAAVGA